MRDARFPDIVWSNYPHNHTLWGLHSNTRPTRWHSLAPHLSAAQTDRGLWVVLHCDHGTLPDWHTMVALFPPLPTWVDPTRWALFLAQWAAVDRDDPIIPLW